MPRYVSHGTGDSGLFHVWPSASVESFENFSNGDFPDDGYRVMPGGVAYCGYTPDEDGNFYQLLGGLSVIPTTDENRGAYLGLELICWVIDGDATRETLTEPGKHGSMMSECLCPECADVFESMNHRDPEWQRAFRAQFPEVFG